jgi:hypothetical protein
VISKGQQEIYNAHLAISRKAQDKLFRLRKQWDDLSEEVQETLQRLERFFNSYPHIEIDDFFLAPHKIWEDESHFPLEFYLTQRAIKAYTQYIKQIEIEDPDSEQSMDRLKKGFKFLYDFCKERGLTFENYGAYLEGNLPCWTEHLKNHKINFYMLHSLSIKVNTVEKRILDFMFGDFYKTFQNTKNKYYTSKKMKDFAEKAITEINKKLMK